MKTKLRMKCRACGHWNRFDVEKFLSAQLDSKLDVEDYVSNYLPLKEEKCSKCGNVIARQKELIRIVKS